jgi:hypothetical protein
MAYGYEKNTYNIIHTTLTSITFIKKLFWVFNEIHIKIWLCTIVTHEVILCNDRLVSVTNEQ